MPRIQVETSVVKEAADQVQQAGATTREAAGYLLSGAIADPGFQTAGALTRFGSAWSAGLAAYARSCDSVAGRLSKASTVYEVTETRLSEAF